MFLRIILGLLLVLSSGALAARQLADVDTAARPRRFTGLRLTTFYGYLWAHRERVQYLSATPSQAQIDLMLNTDGHRYWHHAYRFARSGFSLYYCDFHNPVLGEAYSAMVFMETFVARRPRWKLTTRIATGIGHLTAPYHAQTNPQNLLHGGRFSATLQAQAVFSWHVGAQTSLQVGGALTHFSNGGWRQPNLGSNVPAVTVGLESRFGPKRHHLQPRDQPRWQDELGRVSWYVVPAVGVRETLETGGPLYPVWSLNLYAARRISYKSMWNAGINLIQNDALDAARRDDQPLSGHPNRISLVAGHELFISRVTMLTQLGYYLYDPYRAHDTAIYQRYGLKYYLSYRTFAGISLYTHGGQADFIEWALGFRLGGRKS